MTFLAWRIPPHTRLHTYRTMRKHALFGSFMKAKFPVGFSRTKASDRESAPMLGENTNHLLTELGYMRLRQH